MPIAAGPARDTELRSSASTILGHGHWPRASSDASSIATTTAGADWRARGISF